MPFTITHAVLAPPLARLSGYWIPTAALAIGCMLPDLHRLFMSGLFPLAHQWQGIWKFNLWLGLGFCLLWYGLLRPTFYDALGIRHPLGLQSVKTCLSFIVAMVIGLMLGNATHLIWDGLTHVDSRTFAFHDFLSQRLQLGTQSYPVHRLLQVGTSILFLPVVLYMIGRYWRRYATGDVSKGRQLFFGVAATAITILSLWSAIDYALYFNLSQWQYHTYYVTARCLNELFQTGILLTIAVAALYRLLCWGDVFEPIED